MLGDNPVRECVYTPRPVPPAAVQFVVGAGDVPQQVPRAEIEAGVPKEVTLAPRVALVEVMAEWVDDIIEQRQQRNDI